RKKAESNRSKVQSPGFLGLEPCRLVYPMQYKVILQLFNIWSLIFTLNLISTAITLAPTLALTLILALTLVDVPTRDAQPCVSTWRSPSVTDYPHRLPG